MNTCSKPVEEAAPSNPCATHHALLDALCDVGGPLGDEGREADRLQRRRWNAWMISDRSGCARFSGEQPGWTVDEKQPR